MLQTLITESQPLTDFTLISRIYTNWLTALRIREHSCNSCLYSWFSSQSFWKAGSARKGSQYGCSHPQLHEGKILSGGSAQSRNAAVVLEPLRQCHKPGSPLNIGCCLVIAVFAGAADEWRCQVEHVVYAERNRCVIKPGAPATRIVLRSRDRHDAVSLTVLHLHVLATVPGIAWNFAWPRSSWEA